MAMDKEKLLAYFQSHYLSRQEVLGRLPLNIPIDSFWQELLNRRKARATKGCLKMTRGGHHGAASSFCDQVRKSNEKRQQKRQTQTNREGNSDQKAYMNVRISLQPDRETLGNHESRSQATIFEFIMELENVGGDGQKRPFSFNLR